MGRRPQLKIEGAVELLEDADSGDELRRPDDWAGYRLTPTSIEFWHGRTDRLHRRLEYVRQSHGTWLPARLQP